MRQDKVEARERVEDEYYQQLGEEIDRHPICNPARAHLNPCTTTSDSE